jgi:hypothetical protein
VKRRDALKVIPLSIGGISNLAGTDLGAWDHAKGEPLVAEIKPHQGAPTLFLNGQPAFPGMCWIATPSVKGWQDAEEVRAFAQAGIHIYAFEAGRGIEWVEREAGWSDPFDFSTLEARYGRVLKADPLARFHLRCQLEVPPDDKWTKVYPSECEITSDGKPLGQSFASEVWRRQAKEFLKAFIAHLARIGLLNRCTAFQVGAGHTGEWVKGETSMYSRCGDFGEPMRRYFTAWLRRQYNNDLSSFRTAWNKPDVTFDTAGVPPADEQIQSRLYTFRDPGRERNVIDYYRCLAELCSDLVIDFCRTVKEVTDGRKLTGAFYGYLMELAWNGGFFKERPDSDYSTYQRSGHLGLRRVLESPYVDFLVSPYSYGFRGIGGDSPCMQPSESARIHGKLCIIEDDTRTHIVPDEDYGRTYSLRDSITILRRNFARVVTGGLGIWWSSGSLQPTKEPAFGLLLKNFQELGSLLLRTDRTSSAEIAVLLDDESFFYESDRNYLDVPLIFQQRLWGLPRTGAPFDVYLLEDFIRGLLRPYKLYIFLNSFRLDRARREALNRELRRDGRVAVWIYASGYIQDDLSLEHMTDLTGFKFGMGEQAWGPLMHIVDFTHPITASLPQDIFWGTNSKLSPIFYLDDPDVRVLGQVVFSQGDCKPGMGVKTFQEWTSIYIAAPNIPAQVLRGIARFAGVHLYAEAGDVLYATPDLLAIHTASGGDRTLNLPRQVEEVYDLFERASVARNTKRFHVNLLSRSSTLFYTGAANLLSAFKNGKQKEPLPQKAEPSRELPSQGI